MVTVRKPTFEDFHKVFDDIRTADMAEWYAGTGCLFHVGAMNSLQHSEVALVALDERDIPLCFWGGDKGRLWLFATHSATKRALSLHRILGDQLQDLHDKWGFLYAFADSRNVDHHRWLRWLGFEELSEIDIPPFGLPFKTFIKENPCALTQ